MLKQLLRMRTTLMRGLFHLLYHQFAWSYDWVANLVSLGMWQEWIASVLPYIGGPNVLELGCGPGHLQKKLRDRGVRVVGLDESRQMARIAVIRLITSGLIPEVINGYAQLLPFAADSFHQVLATFPSDYIFTPNALQEIFRVLTPDGECFVLPAAWITANTVKFRSAARLFEITGQVPLQEPDWTRPFIQAGFLADTIPIELSHSRLILIHARKPGINFHPNHPE